MQLPIDQTGKDDRAGAEGAYQGRLPTPDLALNFDIF
jgi:hypothetical protein